ncbi:hypothetical protein SASPL_123570 [Salvia splendens]|uniref:V-type proton ATPase subunit H n=1 Tax=Salvia splendens TaxID=180675 RepID=A0A8X8XRE6_SALSN|nr:hypothetical protein SASPL_123570 [Salvia splendens]
MPADQSDLTTEQVLSRDIPWETYMITKLISSTGLQLLRRYDKKPENYKAQLLDDLILLVVMLLCMEANPKRARLFHDKSLAEEDAYEPFLTTTIPHLNIDFFDFARLLWKGSWFAQEKSCKVLSLIVSGRSNSQGTSMSKKDITTIDDVLKGLVEWLCAQLKKPSHPSRGIPTAINCLATLLKEPLVRSSFVQADGVKFLIPLVIPASSQQSIQLLYETCLCVWLLSFYEPAIEYLATSRSLARLIDVVKGTTKEKVVRVVILTLKNLINKASFAAEMVDLEVPQLLQNLKAQAWSDEDLLEAMNQLEEGLRVNIKRLSSYDKYYQEVILGRLDWAPMHKDPIFWKENITHFEEHDFKVLRILLTILDTSSNPRTLAVACYDLSQFIQYHPAGRIIVTDLKAKDRVMKLMNHRSTEVTKNALLCIQRLFLGAKYASFLQA